MRPRLPVTTLAGVALLGTALGTALPAAAQPPDAAALVTRGTARLTARDWKGALADLREAYDLDPEPGVLARIALAEEGLGRFAEAELHLDEALASTGDPFVERQRERLLRSRAAVAAQLGTVTVEGSPKRAVVKIDGVAKGVLPLFRPLRLPVGPRRIDVTAEGHRPLARTVEVTAGATIPVVADLEPEGGPATPLVAAARGATTGEERPAGWRLTGGGLVVAGLLAAGGGGYLLFGGDDLSTAALTAGTTLLGAGAGAAAAGGIMLIFPPRTPAPGTAALGGLFGLSGTF